MKERLIAALYIVLDEYNGRPRTTPPPMTWRLRLAYILAIAATLGIVALVLTSPPVAL